MGGWARCHRRQFPAGRLPRQTVHKCGIAHGDTYCDGNSYGDRDSYGYGYGNCGSERNSYSYSYPDSNCNGYINANCDPAYTVCCA